MSKIVVLFLGAIGIFTLAGLLTSSSRLLWRFSPPQHINPAELTGAFDPNPEPAIFNNEEVPLPNFVAEQGTEQKNLHVLGDSTAPKQIRVDLTNQKLYAYEGDKQVFNFLISSGKWHKTPTGTFHIWSKFRFTKMEGGSQALHTYYNLPNVPFTMFFYNDTVAKSDGFGIHGTYWHHNFGHPMSHGCINMKTAEAEQLYYWAAPSLGDKKSIVATADNPGTEVVIYGEAPNE